MWSTASVRKISRLSPTVKRLVLEIAKSPANLDFKFKPGQWIDFLVPNLETVGGYSIISTPQLLEQKRLVELAVKASRHPPAAWVHNKAEEGSQVLIKPGGKFGLIQPGKSNSVFIAGGIGITPFISMIRYLRAEPKSQKSSTPIVETKCALIYSAKQPEELLYMDELQTVCDETVFSVSNPSDEWKGRIGRIDENLLSKFVSDVNQQIPTIYYVCGPPKMTETIRSTLSKMKVPSENIAFEKWW